MLSSETTITQLLIDDELIDDEVKNLSKRKRGYVARSSSRSRFPARRKRSPLSFRIHAEFAASHTRENLPRAARVTTRRINGQRAKQNNRYDRAVTRSRSAILLDVSSPVSFLRGSRSVPARGFPRRTREFPVLCSPSLFPLRYSRDARVTDASRPCRARARITAERAAAVAAAAAALTSAVRHFLISREFPDVAARRPPVLTDWSGVRVRGARST